MAITMDDLIHSMNYKSRKDYLWDIGQYLWENDAIRVGMTFPSPWGLEDDMEVVGKAEIDGHQGYWVRKKGKELSESFYTESQTMQLIVQGYDEKAERERNERNAAIYREIKEAEEKAKAEYESFHGFTDAMTPMQKKRTVNILSKKYVYRLTEAEKEVVMRKTRAEFVEYCQNSGKYIAETEKYNGKTEYCIKNIDTKTFMTVTKTEYDYFNYLQKRKEESI